MYQFWLGDILLPITPEKVTIACGTKNTLFDCVNGNEVVFPKAGKLKTIKFQAILPNTEYPFSDMFMDLKMQIILKRLLKS